MEYFRTDQGRIQASFALNAAQLLRQYLDYSRGLPNNKRFEATQTVCVLQALICNLKEHIEQLKDFQRSYFYSPLPDIGTTGLKRHHIKKYTYAAPLSYYMALTSIRNALSHPTHAEQTSPFPSTGYTTIKSESGLVSTFRFIDSPWIKEGRLKDRWLDKDRIKLESKRKNLGNEFPTLEVAQNESGKWQFFNDGKPYIPLFEAEVPLEDLIQYTFQIANQLAQPSQLDWDGHTIVDLLNVA